MREFIFVFFTVLFHFTPFQVYSQNQNTSPIVNLTIEAGVAQIKNPFLIEAYNSRNAFNWGVGFEFGNQSGRFLPWLKFSSYKLTRSIEEFVDSIPAGFPGNDMEVYNARRDQLSFGLTHLLPLDESSAITFKAGLLINNFKEDFLKFSSRKTGMLIGVGYQYKSNEAFTYTLGTNYEFSPSSSNDMLADWSGIVFQAGIALNLAGIENSQTKKKRIEKLKSLD